VSNVQGGAIIGIAQKRTNSNSKNDIKNDINRLIKDEIDSGITSINGMLSFNQRLHSNLRKFKNEILTSFFEKEIIAYGAARSAPFILQLLEIGDQISFVIDDNPKKIGKYLPYSNTPIYGSDYLLNYRSSSQLCFLITGWAQTERILETLRSKFKGKAACIYPSFQIENL
jgi:hypothetical protein